ncbi:MAG TPA: cation-transporting P-type ATPase [Jatrophihabitans sp.]|nr:cation-transporting P-type ATPase [Jatrophihabitans sp.]
MCPQPAPGDRAALYRDLRSDPAGLGQREATRRLSVYGPNVLPSRPGRSWWQELARQLTHPLALLLWLAAVLSLLARTPVLSVAIVAVIAINAAVAYAQERQAARAIQALAAYLPARARALRDGRPETVPAAELVPGDVLLLYEGDRISADARLIAGDIEVDMSALTGESGPVSRAAGQADGAQRSIDAADAVFSGTACTGGEARALVTATGAHTEIGRIAALAQRRTDAESPLERQVRRSAWLISAVAILVGVLFLPLGLLAGLSLVQAAIFSVGLLVANVPEGLLPTITLALAVGVRALARQGAVVKKLSAVETLGSTTVICTDKTGTLTQNAMTVQWVWLAGVTGPLTAADPALARLAAAVMADCTQPDLLVDPMELALVAAAAELGVHPAPIRLATFRFDSRRSRMSVLVQRDGTARVQVKGAPERVLARCTGLATATGSEPMGEQQRQQVLAEVSALAERGLRVLALASRPVGGTVPPPQSADAAEQNLCLLGLVALLDPPRPEVPAAVSACRAAGIRIEVITGDHGETAAEVARRIGLDAHRIVTGDELAAMPETGLERLLGGGAEVVFARSSPEDKLRIAEVLRAQGETVAVTGDGVNDAPALHHADIGVAMGRSGTDVAREAAAMVLTDDNFATIVAAVREGRRVYDNLRKFVLYIFAHAVPEMVPFLLFALSAGAIPLPLTVAQILAIDLGTETLPALALGREPAEPDLMHRPPRRRGEQLISGRLLVRAWLLMGLISAALTVLSFLAVLYRAGWHPGAPTGPGTPLHHAYLQATTMTFATIVACQLGTAFAARTERSSLRSVGLFSNRLLLAGLAGEVCFAAAVCYLPWCHDIFGTAAPAGWMLVLLLPCPPLVWGADEALRWYWRR